MELGNTPTKILQGRTFHTSTSPPLNATWRGSIWQIDRTSSLSNPVRRMEWQILVTGAGASLPKIATGYLTAEKSLWFFRVLQKISMQNIVCYSVIRSGKMRHWSYSTRICRKPISCGKASALCFSFNISCHYWITVLPRSVLRESLARQCQLYLINKVCIYRFNNIVKGKMSSGVTRTSNLNLHQTQDNHQSQKDCITC